MPDDKDIRFTQKKVDESWKDNIVREREKAPSSSQTPAKPQPKTSKPFLNLLSTLGLQAMMHLGEVPLPDGSPAEINLDAGREMIELLMAVQAKSAGNLSPEEKEVFDSLLPELQMKFAQKS